jgi:P27 family predicted phage terminase small subunit
MAQEGHKVPTKIKLLRGTARADRIKSDELEFRALESLPKPPEWMGDVGKIEFNSIIDEYFNVGILSKLDLPSLSIYCQAYDDYVRLTGYTKGNETQTHSDSGIESNLPQVILRQRAMDTVLKFATQFGLTVIARSKISNNKKEEDKDSFEETFGKTG